MITHDTVIRIGRRYGRVFAEGESDSQCEISFSADQLVALLEFVAVCEREACAKVCEDYTDNDGGKFIDHEGHGYECAAAIRARGKSK